MSGMIHTSPNNFEKEKEMAALRATSLVKSGLIVGLGSGSTASYAIRALGNRCREGLDILGVPTSEKSKQLAIEVGIPLTTLDAHPVLDITIDGADRFNANLDLIKGGGGALLREKIVAAASKRLVIIVDSRKKVKLLGGFPVPIEVIQFGIKPLVHLFEKKGLRSHWRMRKDKPSEPYITDEQNYILDLEFETIENPKGLAQDFVHPGIVEHGLFIDMADEVFMGSHDRVVHFVRNNTSFARQ